MKENDDRDDENMSCTEISQPNRKYNKKQYVTSVGVNNKPPYAAVESSSLESNTSCDIWEEAKTRPSLVYSPVVFQRRPLSPRYLNDVTTIPPSPPPLSLPYPTIQQTNKKLCCTYQFSYLIVFMCASATLLATGIWCWIKFPSSHLLELQWNSLYTLALRHSNIVAIVIGGFLLFWLFVMGMWLANKSFKLWVKMSYWLWLFFSCCLTTSFGILNVVLLSHSFLYHSGENMWKQMISNHQESTLCTIQQLYGCHGWNSQVNESVSCVSNNAATTTQRPFCAMMIYVWLQHYFLPQVVAFLMVSLMGWIELVSFIVVHKKKK